VCVSSSGAGTGQLQVVLWRPPPLPTDLLRHAALSAQARRRDDDVIIAPEEVTSQRRHDDDDDMDL